MHVLRDEGNLLYMYRSANRFIIQIMYCLQDKTSKKFFPNVEEMPKTEPKSDNTIDWNAWRLFTSQWRHKLIRICAYHDHTSTWTLPSTWISGRPSTIGQPRVATPDHDRHIWRRIYVSDFYPLLWPLSLLTGGPTIKSVHTPLGIGSLNVDVAHANNASGPCWNDVTVTYVQNGRANVHTGLNYSGS